MSKNKDERMNRLGDLPDDAERISGCLRKLEWTQQRAADEIGISQPNFNAFLNGKRPLSRAASARLLEAIRRGYEEKMAAAAVSQKPRLTPESAARIRARAFKSLGVDPDRTEDKAPPLTFEQSAQMTLDEVIQGVTHEIYSGSSGYLRLFSLGNRSATPEELDAATGAYVKAQVDADPRVRFAELQFRLGAAEAWIKRVEKERNDLKHERDDLKRELLKANEELLEAYRRIVTLEKVAQ